MPSCTLVPFARIFSVSMYTLYNIFTQVNVQRSIKHNYYQ